MWKEWVIDASMSAPEGCACFVPYEREEDTFVLGMNLISDRCPGELLGVIHANGQEAVEEWCKANPDWHDRHKRLDAAHDEERKP